MKRSISLTRALKSIITAGICAFASQAIAGEPSCRNGGVPLANAP